MSGPEAASREAAVAAFIDHTFDSSKPFGGDPAEVADGILHEVHSICLCMSNHLLDTDGSDEGSSRPVHVAGVFDAIATLVSLAHFIATTGDRA